MNSRQFPRTPYPFHGAFSQCPYSISLENSICKLPPKINVIKLHLLIMERGKEVYAVQCFSLSKGCYVIASSRKNPRVTNSYRLRSDARKAVH